MWQTTVGLLACLTAASCATREVPYRFRGDLVGQVSAREAPAPKRQERARRARRATSKRVAKTSKASRRAVTKASSPTTTRRVVVRKTRRPSDEESPLATRLRGLVGTRKAKVSHVDFALETLEDLGVDVAESVRVVTSGVALVRLAQKRKQGERSGDALLGDLVVFDRVVGRKSASLLGVAVSTHGDGTIEFVYLARGVVRRGYVNPTKPDSKRDKSGKILNTFVRHSNGGDARGTRYLAGRLLSGVIRLDQLQR